MHLNWTRCENEAQVEKGIALFLLLLVFVYLCSNRFFGNCLEKTDYPAPKDAFQKITLGHKIDINSEPLEGILAVPYMTPRMARDIVSFREKGRPIRDRYDLEKALGRNRNKLTLILPYVKLGAE